MTPTCCSCRHTSRARYWLAIRGEPLVVVSARVKHAALHYMLPSLRSRPILNKVGGALQLVKVVVVWYRRHILLVSAEGIKKGGDLMAIHSLRRTLTAVAVFMAAILSQMQFASAQPVVSNLPTSAATTDVGEIVVTGSRIPRKDNEGVSPVDTVSSDQIKLQNALTIEDFSTTMPELAGGTNGTNIGSDAHGAQVLDLYNLGQNRTLVLIDGTRAIPFSFRNSVDVNSIPAPLIKQVDVLTGGAAAVYGADAVAGVVNFIMNSDFDGVQASATYRNSQGGGSEYGPNLIFGTSLGENGHITGYIEYTERDALTAGARSYATPNSPVSPPAGGNFTDIASGRTFAFTNTGQFTTTPQTTNYSNQYLLAEPLKRTNADLFFNEHLSDVVESYGRFMFSDVRTTESSSSGFAPLAVDKTVGISSTNPFLTPSIRNNLTFVNGVAQVRVDRSLGEAGILTDDTDRQTYQGQIGFRGAVWRNIKWDAYVQDGRVTELTTGNAELNGTPLSSVANTTNIFGPGDAGLLALVSPYQQALRTREVLDSGVTISGDSKGIFALPAGPIGFAIGFQHRNDIGDDIEANAAPYNGTLRSNEGYGELLIPVLKDLPFAKRLEIEGAYRRSQYDTEGSGGNGSFGPFGTNKLGLAWTVDDDVTFRGSHQTVVRVPNFNEIDGSVASLPLNYLVTVPRLTPRYAGDPCALGTGNAAQCAALGYKGSYNSFDPANLTGSYFFGGNPNIQPETGKTYTFGSLFTPRFLPNFRATVDYYNIDLENAIGVIQPVSALAYCYITNPTPGNPLCPLVSRNPATGYLQNAYVNQQNLTSIKESGLDMTTAYSHDVPEWMPGKRLLFQYQGNLVLKYTIQQNASVPVANCRGTFGIACSSDGVSLVQAGYKHYVTVGWEFEKLLAQIAWQRIGSVRDSALDATDRIAAYDYFNLALSFKPNRYISVNFSVNNLLDKQPPIVTNSAEYNTYPDTYDVLGRTFGISFAVRQ
jgi:iron complex outermembrane receptor protein